MRYVKAADVLPQGLIDQIQRYIDGEYLYVPRREANRKPWGANTNRKAVLPGRIRGPAGRGLFSLAQEHSKDHRPTEISHNHRLSRWLDLAL